MLHVIKVGAEVDVNDARLLLDNRFSYPVHRFLRCPFRTISVRPRLEIGFEDRLQNELECPLDHSITDCRNRKNADFLAPVLGNLTVATRPFSADFAGAHFYPALSVRPSRRRTATRRIQALAETCRTGADQDRRPARSGRGPKP